MTFQNRVWLRHKDEEGEKENIATDESRCY